jgi:CPA1 family monovalent cation:H+ antiporter
VVSLVLASAGLPRVLKGLELPEESDEQAEEFQARHEAANAAIAAVDKAGRTRDGEQPGEVSAAAAEHVVGLYQHRLGTGAGSSDGAHMREADQAEREFRLVALKAERDTILKLARLAKISDATARKLLREIDLVEARYR